MGPLRPYVIKQGDYLAKLAHVLGFDAEEVWDHPKNAALKALRKSADILHPGDVLFVPESPKPRMKIQAGTTNRYIATVPKVTVNLVLKDEAHEAFADEPYRIEGLRAPIEGKTGPDGSLSFSVPVHLREVSVVLPERGMVLPVRVGDLDPLDEPSGIRMRLAHLGYLDWSPGEEVDDGAVSNAIEAFQAAHGLEPTGALDDATKQALEKAHGV